MNNLNLLYRYELKKITGRKLFWITLLLCLLTIISVPALSLTGKYYVDGVFADTHYHMFLVDQAYEKALSGRAIDQTLLKETLTAYRKIQDPEGRYTPHCQRPSPRLPSCPLCAGRISAPPSGNPTGCARSRSRRT